MMKPKLKNGMTDRTDVVYADIETKLSQPIRKDAVYHEKQIWQGCDQSYGCDLCRIHMELSRPIRQRAVYDEDETG